MKGKPVAQKAYYSIGEVCDLTDLKPHVLRYWESQFDVLHPNKNRAGNRVYRPKEVQLILLVKHLLYDRKFTIEGANQRLIEMRRTGELKEARETVLKPAFLAGMKQDLQEVMEALSPPVRLES
jgi:DNA-binding transcriptional MerR regulator